MNGTDTAAGLMSGNGWLTSASLVVIAILVIVVILAIWWGSRLRARQRSERPEMPPVTSERTIASAEPPVSPAPPPLADTATGALVEPKSAAPPASAVSAADGGGDAAQPVTMLKGLGPKVAARLGELGVTTVGQIAALSPAEAEALDADLGTFRGRMKRDRWIEQAKLLAAGDTVRYEATFGKLG